MNVRMIAILIILMLIGCARKPTDSSLMRVQEMIDDTPRNALDSLEAINPSSLSDRDRHLYDLLTVKAQDKAYIRHTSDSLILDVIDYYKSHKSLWLYPEALYYGARVYSDLGDYPTALKYFQDALDALHEQSANLDLEGRIVSQYARLLNNFRLYDRAVPHIKKAIEIDRTLKNSINEVHDLHLLGNTFTRMNELASAENTLTEALTKSGKLSEHLQAKSALYLAETKLRLGQIESALGLIRDTPAKVNTLVRNHALATAAEIYCHAGIPDTAYLYAHQLISSDNIENKMTGYHIILSPAVCKYIGDKDSMIHYMADYRALMEMQNNTNQNQLVIMQENAYNYGRHVKEKENAMARAGHLEYVIWILVFTMLILTIIILLLKNRNKTNIIKLHTAIENIDRLQSEIARHSTSTGDNNQTGSQDEPTPYGPADTIDSLRERLRAKLISLSESGPDQPGVPPQILNSEAYLSVMDRIKSNSAIGDDSSLWKDLEKTVLSVSPAFISNLKLLVGGKVSSFDIRTALLIKCGFSTSQISKACNRTKGTIVSRRESLCWRVFDEKKGAQAIDDIVRLL